jgi:hypothetical protein
VATETSSTLAANLPEPHGYLVQIQHAVREGGIRRGIMAGRLQQLLPKSRTGYWRIFVKTRIQSLSFLATLALAMICWGSALQAQNTPSTTPDRQAQQPSSSPDTTPPQSTPETQAPSSQSPSSQTPDSTQSPDTTTPPPSSRTPESGAQQPPSGSGADSGAAGTQTFSGTVVKQGDKYVLKDDSGHTYDIDHQDEVKKFDGKRVRVQGTLDPSTNKIMVK